LVEVPVPVTVSSGGGFTVIEDDSAGVTVSPISNIAKGIKTASWFGSNICGK